MIWIVLIVMSIICFRLGAAYMLLGLLAVVFKGITFIAIVLAGLFAWRWYRRSKKATHTLHKDQWRQL